MSKIIINPALPRKLACIVSDMDGTILPETFRISARTAAAFKRAQSLGIVTILSSGRSAASIRPYWEQIGGGFPYIASNGAQTLDASGKVLREETIDVPTAHEIIHYLRGEGVYFQTYYDEFFYHESHDNPMPEHYENSTGLKGVFVEDLIEKIDSPTVKLLGISEPEHVTQMLKFLSDKYYGKLNISISNPYFLEIAPLEATKGKAIASLTRSLGIDAAHTLALGDSLNDVSMLRWAGMSCAVGDCHPEVKQICTWNTCACEDDGAAILIESLLNEGFKP